MSALQAKRAAAENLASERVRLKVDVRNEI